MNTYLGEISIDVSKSPVFKDWTPSQWAMKYVETYGQGDGAHHKTWVLDQVARILLGTPVVVSVAKWDNGEQEYRFNTGEPSKEYLAWVDKMLGKVVDDENGEREYSYDEGIAP